MEEVLHFTKEIFIDLLFNLLNESTAKDINKTKARIPTGR